MLRFIPDYESILSRESEFRICEIEFIKAIKKDVNLTNKLNEIKEDLLVYFKPRFYSDRVDFVIIKKNSGVILVDCAEMKSDIEVENIYKRSNDVKEENSSYERNKPASFQKLDTIIKNLINTNIKTVSIDCSIYKNHIFLTIQNLVFFEDKLYKDNFKDRKIEQTDLFTFLEGNYFFKKSIYFSDKLYENFMEFLETKIKPNELYSNYFKPNPIQEKLMISERGNKKIAGFAGSGKTTIMLYRAINAVKRTQKQVLILCFNITLVNCLILKLMNLLRNEELDIFTKIEINYYHSFFESKANYYRLKITSRIKDKDTPDYDRLNFFKDINSSHKYAAIFIDEVQDYQEVWLKILQNNFLVENGEFVVFADEKQNVYQRVTDEKKMPVIPKTHGGWDRTLKKSFRLGLVDDYGTQLVNLFIDFQYKFMINRYNPDIKQMIERRIQQPELYQCISTIEYFARNQLIVVIRDIAKKIKTDNLLLVSTAIICEKNITAGRICSYFEDKKIKFLTTALTKKEVLGIYSKHGNTNPSNEEIQLAYEMSNDSNNEFYKYSKAKKFHFTIKPEYLRISSIHSFKGFEAENIFVVIENDDIKPEVLYTALTRTSQNLYIYDISEHKIYRSFFEEHDNRDTALKI